MTTTYYTRAGDGEGVVEAVHSERYDNLHRISVATIGHRL